MQIRLKEIGRKILLLIDGKKEGVFPKGVLRDIKDSNVEEEVIRKLYEEIIIPYAKEIVLRNLNVRDRTEKEVIEILKKREFSQETIKRVINDLKFAGLIDDLKTAKYIIQNSHGKSKMELREKLRKIGIEEGQIEELLKDYDEEEALKNEILKLKKKFKDIKRLKRHLIYKGFDYYSIDILLREIKE